jgi:hypothetical protein
MDVQSQITTWLEPTFNQLARHTTTLRREIDRVQVSRVCTNGFDSDILLFHDEFHCKAFYPFTKRVAV